MGFGLLRGKRWFAAICLFLSLLACSQAKKEVSTEGLTVEPKQEAKHWLDSFEGGESLVGDKPLFSVREQNPETTISLQDNILTVRNTKAASDVEARAIRWFPEVDVGEGDLIVIAFEAKTLYAESESQEGKITTTFETRYDWKKSLQRSFNISTEWREYVAAFDARYPGKANEIAIAFELGHYVQTIDFRKVRIVNFEDHHELADFSNRQTDIDYEGREADAPWRRAAAKRIEKLRKADNQISLRDSEGRVLANKRVRVRMRQHAFGFGTALSAFLVGGEFSEHLPDGRAPYSEAERERYLEVAERYFDHNVVENSLKWTSWEEPLRRRNALKTIAWSKAHGKELRGHNLIWPSWKRLARGEKRDYVPYDLYQLREDKAAIRRRIREHFRDIMKATKGELVDWDVINEPRVNHDLMDLLGYEEMGKWMCLAKEFDADAKLYIDEYGILTGGAASAGNRAILKEHVQMIRETGCPIDGLGFQSHFGENPVAPTELLAALDEMAETGLILKVTEFDINSNNLSYQADYTRDFLTAVFSHPAVEAAIVWGFWERSHWRPNAALWDKDWNIKPNGQVYLDLVRGEWWTDISITSNDKGLVEFRGFRGRYEVLPLRPDGSADEACDSHSADLSQATNAKLITLNCGASN